MTPKPERNLHLNLSRRPARNTLFFRVALAVLAGLFFGLSAGAAFLIVRTGSEMKNLRVSLEKTARATASLQAEERREAAAVQAVEKELGKTVEAVNSAIFRKSYRLTDVLAAWESALPDGSHVAAFSPAFSGPSALAIRAKVVSRNLEDLHLLVENLRRRDFRNIRVENETQDDQGRLVAEITMSHERLF
ncbi:MAG: hypothetical protein SCM96_14250 [Acidobacteriota bacterium]|nr:hypothetical protein [Acidobacteriota bacterium]